MASKTKWVISAIISLLITGIIYLWSVFYNWGVPYFQYHFSFSRMILPFILFFILAVLCIRVLFFAVSAIRTALPHAKQQFKEQRFSPPTPVAITYEQPSPESRSGSSDSRLPLNKREAEMMAAQWLKQAADSVKIINTTKKPSTFFERYDFFIDTLERLAYCERWVSFRGELPSSKLRNIETEQKEQIRLFILRYAQDTREKMYQLSTAKGKLNKAETYYNTLNEYSNRLDKDNILLLTEQYGLLKNIA